MDVRELTRVVFEILGRTPITEERIPAILEEAFEKVWAENLVWRPLPEWPGAPVFHGREGVHDFYREWFATFDEITMGYERLEAGEDRSATTCVMRGTIGGAATEMRFGVLGIARDDRVAEVIMFLDPEDAYRALRS